MCPQAQDRSPCVRVCRRRFLAATGRGALAVGLPIAGCGSVELEVLREDVEVDLSEHADLEAVGRTVLVYFEQLAFPLAVTRSSAREDDFIVTGTECNHQGCEVERRGEGWRCPCHRAEFDLDGRLRKGPATEGLVTYDYEVVDTVMTVLGRM